MTDQLGVDSGAALTQEAEPVIARTVAAIVVSGLLDALVALGVHLSPAGTVYVTAGVNLLVLAALAYAIRRKVFSPATVEKIVTNAAAAIGAARLSPASTDIGAAIVQGAADILSTETTGPAAPAAPVVTAATVGGVAGAVATASPVVPVAVAEIPAPPVP